MRTPWIATLLLLTGCFHFHYVNTAVPPAPAAQEESWHHGFLWGIVEASPAVPVSRICPNVFARVDSEESFVNGFLQVITWSIYSPQTVSVTCSGYGSAPPSPNKPWGK